MRKLSMLVTVLIISLITTSCGNDRDCVKKIKEEIKENALGIDLNYQNIEFNWVDTLCVNEKLEILRKDYNTRLNVILSVEWFISDNFKSGKIFTKNYLTKERFKELRSWETRVGHSLEHIQKAILNGGYKDYYDYIVETGNVNATEFTKSFCNQIEKTDKLLNKYDDIEEGNLELIENSLWFYNRIDSYESDHKPHRIWETILQEVKDLYVIRKEIDSLSLLPQNNVIYYKAFNLYEINNPLLNGVKQEIKGYFYFNSNMEIIRKDVNQNICEKLSDNEYNKLKQLYEDNDEI